MNPISTRDPRFLLCTATPDDAALVVNFMKKLGAYQKMADKITATVQNIHQLLTGKKGEAIFGMYDGQLVGFVYSCQTSQPSPGNRACISTLSWSMTPCAPRDWAKP